MLAAGATTIVVPNSTKKLIPITPNIKKAPIFGKVSLTPLSRNGLKNINAPMQNKPVLIIGTSALATNKPKYLPTVPPSFSNKRYTKLAARPARVHLSRHTKTVATGLIGIKIAMVDGENNAIMPLKKPKIIAEIGPHHTAAKTTATKVKLIFAGPN